MQQHSHNVAILAGIKKSRHVRYDNDKREVTSHESDADSSKERDKNEEQEERDDQATQETHTMNSQTIEILKLLFTKIQIIFEQKVIK